VGTSRTNDSINRWLSSHHSLITRARALGLGLSKDEIDGLLRRRDWERLHSGVYRPATAPRGPLQLLYGACLAAGDGAVASHRSAAWLWDLVDRPPAMPEISVPATRSPRLNEVIVHRSTYLDVARTRMHKGIRTTDPLLTLVDFAARASRQELTTATDRALARQLTAVPRVETELTRAGRRGRPGVGPLRQNLKERGVIGAPHPSVLESMMIRLLVRYHLPIPKVELIAGPDGEYRLDFSYPEVKRAIEVDGYVYHFSPEHLRRDHARRNALQRQGWRLLVFTWLDVTRDGRRVADEIRAFYADEA
jgi:hypothetical protein